MRCDGGGDAWSRWGLRMVMVRGREADEVRGADGAGCRVVVGPRAADLCDT